MFTWQAGPYSGVTDSKPRAFRNAEEYAQPDAEVCQVELTIGLRYLTYEYRTEARWSGQVRNGTVAWSGPEAP